MPTQHGRHEAMSNPNHAETALSDLLHAPEVSNLLSDLLPGLPFQIDFVDAICTSASSNGLTFPEFLGTVVNFLSGIGILVGIIAVLGVGIIAYGFSKMSATSGGGGGKKYIVGGIFIFLGGVLAYTIPAFADQSLDGGGSCIATTAMVPPEIIETVMTVAMIVF